MKKWQYMVSDLLTTPETLAKVVDVDTGEIAQVHKIYPLCINTYYLGLIQKKNDAIWRQAIPDMKELTGQGIPDPLKEVKHSPVSTIVHRYPDRVLLYVSYQCSVFCRFCTRKRMVKNSRSISKKSVDEGIEYIRNHPEIRDVLISGGDPLMLSDSRIEDILKQIRAIKHVQIIRIGTRMPVTLPQRITDDFCGMLKKYHPLFINTHFNHPDEITPQSTEACTMLSNAGIPLGNQSVLLKGINDTPEIMKLLVQKLLSIRVKPYYIYLPDLVKGTDHFRTSIQTGFSIIKALQGHTSGLAIPHLVVDAPDGGGKIPIMPNSIVSVNDFGATLKNYEGKEYTYPSMECQLTPV